MATTNRKKPTAQTKAVAEPARRPIRREVGAVVCLFLAIFSFIGYFDISAWFIDFFCGSVKGLIGWGYYLFPPALLTAGVILVAHKGRPVRLRVVSTMLLPLIFGAFVHLMFAGGYALESGIVAVLFEDGKDMLCGGLLSGMIAILFENMFSVFGAIPVLFFALVILLLTSLRITLPDIFRYFTNRKPAPAYVPPPEPPTPEPLPPAIPTNTQPKNLDSNRRSRDVALPADESAGLPGHEDEGIFPKERKGFFNRTPRVKTPDQVLTGAADSTVNTATDLSDDTGDGSSADIDEAVVLENDGIITIVAPPPEAPVPVQDASEDEYDPEPEEEPWDILEISDPPKKFESNFFDDDDDEIEDDTDISSLINENPADYTIPPLHLLKSGANNVVDGREEIAANRERLGATLKSFGVSAKITGAIRGPTVTRYDVELEAGVKLTKILNLSNDIALSLGVANVRIAPIPDKIATVGVEVPNKIISTVYLRDIIESPEFSVAQSKLSFAIGKDISGTSIVGNISKLPHMLIAGTTGSGKSVCMNSLILSLLYKATPQEVRLIMIDPKMVELGIYNGIPHLYIPVVTDPKKAAGALQWSVVEMLRRYRTFSELGVRDLSGYNAHMTRKGEPIFPQVVIVIDELADLMLVASKEVEESICRVAQMGRAAGMHLIIATQRPSSDIITGLMKANIPSRIAFAVSSAMESRIIMDSQGAEKLMGAGDMLYAPIGAGKPIRIQGAYVTDEEREDVINYVKASGGDAEYNEEIMEQIERAAEPKTTSDPSNDAEDYDEMLPQAVDVIFDTKQASVSMLQRKLKLGYARAARIVDQMEEIGIVGEFEGSKPRQILMTREQWLSGKGATYRDDEPEYTDDGDDVPPFDLDGTDDDLFSEYENFDDTF